MSLTRTSKRLVSLDVLRGITVCGMILVNNAGACGYAYAPLKHAKWDGFTPADLVFPAFMFIMGVSIYLSLNKSNFDWRISIARILRRTVLIFMSGVALKWILAFIATGEYNTLENLRIMGVLQRLGICYGIVALLAVTVRHRLFPTIIAVLLVGYYLLQLFGNGFEKCAGNIVSMVDYAVLGKSHMYLGGAQFVDPEGVLSTIPAIAQVMIGFLCGKVIVGEKEIRSQIVKLAVWGTSMFVIGYLWSYAAPLNKRLWSPSFVLVTCGITSLIFATLIYIIAVLLVGYYLLQLFGNGFEKCAGNIVSMVDYAVLGKSHMYLGGAQFVDPEGVLSTIPAIAQVMIGFLCGKVIVGEKEIRSQIVKLAVWGTSMFVIGYLWSYAAPLNKRLWSPSFVLVTCGITSLIFATLIYIIDDSKRTRWSFPFLVVGVNPLSIYIFSEIAGGLFRKLQWTTISFEGIWQPLFGNYGGSLAYALAFLMFNWLIAFFLYKKHIYIKL